jgi:hypothetical protein
MHSLHIAGSIAVQNAEPAELGIAVGMCVLYIYSLKVCVLFLTRYQQQSSRC